MQSRPMPNIPIFCVSFSIQHLFVVFASKENKKGVDTQEKVSVKDVKISAKSSRNSREILKEFFETGGEPKWTAFGELYAKGEDYLILHCDL